jgi:DNA-binding response OmpR family regulator
MLYAGMPFDLRNREFDIFALLLENPGTIFSREQILELSSDGTSAGSLASVDVHISNIRKRLKKLKVRNLIHTVHLKGYRLE